MLEIANDTDSGIDGGFAGCTSAHDTTCNYRHVALPQVPRTLYRSPQPRPWRGCQGTAVGKI